MHKLKLYSVDPDYVEYLNKYSEHVFHSNRNKSSRKYVGIIFEINNFKYFAPLSSFKKKHNHMKESVDFIKIKKRAVLNINNMIPVPKGLYKSVKIKMNQIFNIDFNYKQNYAM